MIYLRYGHWSSGSIVWQPGERFRELQLIPTPFTTRLQGIDLRYDPYNSLMDSRTKWKLMISADELVNPIKYAFIKNFFTADYWQISFTGKYHDTEASVKGTDFSFVDLAEAGALPQEFKEGNKYLPEITFNLTEKRD